MEIKFLKDDIDVLCIKASSFPEGVLDAHAKLAAKAAPAPGRQYYGISHPVKDEILYKAAATEVYPGEAEKLQCEKQTIRHGLFISQFIPSWQERLPEVQNVFETLIADERVDARGYCLEKYVGDKDMLCMVPLDASLVMKADRKELMKEIDAAYSGLDKVVARFTDEQFNRVPFEGSWTAGQVVDHILKGTGGIPDANTRPVDREYNASIGPVLAAFSDYTIRMQAPESIAPAKGPFNVSEALKALRELKARHEEAVRTKDLHALCLDFELPHTGLLTRYEWFKFIASHAERHLHQLKNILSKMQ